MSLIHSYEMTTSVRFRLSYNPVNFEFIAHKMNNISKRKRMVDTYVIDDDTCTRQCVNQRVVIRFYRAVIH